MAWHAGARPTSHMSNSRESGGIWGRMFGSSQQDEDADSLLRGARDARTESAELTYRDVQSDVVLDISSGARGASTSRNVDEEDAEPPLDRTSNDEDADDAGGEAAEEIIQAAADQAVADDGERTVLLSARSSTSSDASATCLICLDSLDPTDTRNTVHLGCMCKGAAAYRHKACLDQWLTVKGDTKCDVCGAEMKVPLPPPPPVPGYVIFPDLDHGFETQWATFGRYVWQNAVAVVVYCVVLALIMDIPLQIAMMIAAFVLAMIMVRYAVSVAVNSIAGRTILAFQVPETS